ncbi:NUDIX domain-containing protein [Mycobacteroides abscessus]|uniref:NUDIX domain-containing protein n=1 Tax=Mycobacteroides abscessus TaxID=36809 RepID=UPI000C268DC0|nr:NUDIX hydrolase [Mycobacteroides abscessus]
MIDTLAGFSVSVAGIVIDRQQVLLIQRADNQLWEPPGGVLEHDETFAEGVRREVFEETGIFVDVHEMTGCYLNLPRRIVALVFRCTPISGAPTITAESTATEWVPLNEAMTRLRPVFAVRLADAIADRGYTAVRTHDGHTVL